VEAGPDTFEGRPGVGAASGVVPVCHDDGEAPAGCAALRELRGKALLVRAVGALLRSEVVGSVTVVVPPVLVPLVEDLLGPIVEPDADAVRVLPARENGHGHCLQAALREVELLPDRPVVVHDPLYPLAPPALVRSVVQALIVHGLPEPAPPEQPVPGRPGVSSTPCIVAVPVQPVTDTLKWVDEDGIVLCTADRERFWMASSPQASWPAGLQAVLEAATREQLCAVGAEVLPSLVRAGAGQLVFVPAPGEVFRLTTTEDLVLADAMLHAGAGTDDWCQQGHRS
jgi:2-C-methyl-D-erythritol 4-phosphate cytidylyltransferase